MAYLEKHRRLWYALHDLSPGVRPAFGGRRRFKKSLGTESKTEARRRMVPLEAEWRRRIAEATCTEPDRLAREYGHWLRAIRDANTEEERELTADLLRDELQARLHHEARQAGVDLDDDEALQSLPAYTDTIDAYKYATGQKVRLDFYLSEFLEVREFAPKTVAQWRAAVLELAGIFPFVDQVTGPAVQGHINERLRSGTTVGTIRKQLSGWRSYWRYLAGLGIVARKPTPFDDLDLPKKRRGAGRPRDAFTQAEAVNLLKAAMNKPDPALADLIRIGMWTGARRQEICGLRIEDVDDGFLTIGQSKTDAGVRSVPIHPRLAPTIQRLIADSHDGYLIPGLKPNSLGDRGDAIGKRFGKLKDKLGFDGRLVFHSLRATVSTLLENAAVPANLAADIVGHSKTGMTYGYYSTGNSRDTMASAIAKIDYPDYPGESS